MPSIQEIHDELDSLGWPVFDEPQKPRGSAVASAFSDSKDVAKHFDKDREFVIYSADARSAKSAIMEIARSIKFPVLITTQGDVWLSQTIRKGRGDMTDSAVSAGFSNFPEYESGTSRDLGKLVYESLGVERIVKKESNIKEFLEGNKDLDELNEFNESVLPQGLQTIHDALEGNPKEMASQFRDYAENNLTKVGSGDEKQVYELDNNVLVIPTRDTGFEETALRVQYENNNEFQRVLPDVIAGSENGAWLVMENLDMSLNTIENKYEELFGMGSNELLDVVEAEFGESNLPDEVIQRKHDKINDLDYFYEYVNMMEDVKDKSDVGFFDVGEFLAPRNVGIDNQGNLVNADFGII